MIRKFLSLVSVVFIISACGNQGKNEAALKSGDASKVEFASLAENPDAYIGKNIVVEGKVVHVCMETGKKLFITGDNPDIMLYIQAGENMPKFPLDLMGSTVEVEGTITIPAAGMQESHGMKESGGMTQMSDSCSTESALSKQTALADIMMEYKSHSVK
ncbi:MAG TPA: hypothetical protein VK213_03575 [Bacteroidales bacterium]|nr:hypothetical protein [Bacteroidales bacterium]